MPIACDPRQTVDVCLPGDDAIPADARPTFTYRYLTVAEFYEQKRVFAEWEHAENDKAADAKIAEALTIGLRSWRNLRKPPAFGQDVGEPIPCGSDPAAFAAALRFHEKFELYARVQAAVGLGAPEKKRSGSPPTSEPAPSAAPAENQAAA